MKNVRSSQHCISMNFCSDFSNLRRCLESLPKTRVWQLEREEKWLDKMWDNSHSSDFQLQWKLDFRMNGLSFDKLVDLGLARSGFERHANQLKKAIPAEKRQNS